MLVMTRGRGTRARWLIRLGLVLVPAILLSGAPPALAAPAAPGRVPPGQTQPGPGSAALTLPPGSASLAVPGTGERRPAFTSLTPIAARALPGSPRGRAATLDPVAAAAAKPRTPGVGAVKIGGAEVAASAASAWYCDEAITKSVAVGEDESGTQTARPNYLAEVGCNFYLAAATGVAGVVDRSDGFDGLLLSVGSPFAFTSFYYGASAGNLVVNGSQYDNARRVEVVFELYLQSPDRIPWGACNPLLGLRYLLCDGIGTDVLHIVVGTGPFDTGLRPAVVQQVSLGDSYASGNSAGNYYGPSGCYRSSYNYAWQINGLKTVSRATIALPNVVACSGARIIDIMHQGVGSPPKTGMPEQISALDPLNTRLVTISVGGNDLRFTKHLSDCYLGDCSGAPLLTTADLQTVQDRLTKLYKDVRARMRPDGVLAVMAYPLIFPAAGDPDVDYTTCPVTLAGLTGAELNRIQEAFTNVRDMLARAVNATGDQRVVLVDTLDALRGHSICSRDPWANGLQVADLDIFGSYHPNQTGHGVEATRIAQMFGLTVT